MLDNGLLLSPVPVPLSTFAIVVLSFGYVFFSCELVFTGEGFINNCFVVSEENSNESRLVLLTDDVVLFLVTVTVLFVFVVEVFD